MPIFRVTYRCAPGVRWLMEDVEADRHDIRNNWHVFALVRSVVGLPRWTCALRVHDREVWAITATQPGPTASRRGRGEATSSHDHDPQT